MTLYIFILLVSLLIHFILIVPFIDFLYKKKFQRADQKTIDAFDKPSPIFDKFHHHKFGTPVGGGILIVAVTSTLSLFFLYVFYLLGFSMNSNYPSAVQEILLLVFTFVSFAFLGIYDDLNKIFYWENKTFFGIKLKTKLILEVIIATIISSLLYFLFDISIVHIPFFGVFDISYIYILFSVFVIVSFANAVNITDGLDGLASGALLMALLSFWVVARSIIDVPLSVFIAVWIGGVIAFLYFNIYPARVFLGDAGALSFGATFAVIGLLLGKSFTLPIIGGIFLLEVGTSLIQLVSKKYRNKKVFKAAPLHLMLQYYGWEEPKIVMRFWVGAIVFALIGLMIAFLK